MVNDGYGYGYGEWLKCDGDDERRWTAVMMMVNGDDDSERRRWRKIDLVNEIDAYRFSVEVCFVQVAVESNFGFFWSVESNFVWARC